jgi:hypothetical protein
MGVLDPHNNILTTATARNKKVAEQEASRLALEQLEPSLNESFNTKGSSTVDKQEGAVSKTTNSVNDTKNVVKRF